MACSYTIAGIMKDCDTSIGGIKRVFITSTNPKAVTSDGIVTEFENSDAVWYEYAFKKNTSSMTSTLNVDPANGINYVSTELVLQFNRMDTAKRIEISALALNEMWVIALDCNNKYWFLGYNEPVAATAGTSQTGTAKGDGNFYQITLTDESETFPYEVSDDIVPTGPILIETAIFTQNPRVVSEGYNTITYSISPNNTTEAYTIYSSDETVLKVYSYMNNTCSYEALKQGSATLAIATKSGKVLHSVVIAVVE